MHDRAWRDLGSALARLLVELDPENSESFAQSLQYTSDVAAWSETTVAVLRSTVHLIEDGVLDDCLADLIEASLKAADSFVAKALRKIEADRGDLPEAVLIGQRRFLRRRDQVFAAAQALNVCACRRVFQGAK